VQNEIKIIVVPNGASIEPELGITLSFSERYEERVPIKCTGHLFIDNIKFATLHELENNKRIEYYLSDLEKENQGSIYYRNFTFVAPLTPKAIARLEQRRNANPKGELIFTAIFSITTIQSLFEEIPAKSQVRVEPGVKLQNGKLAKIAVTDLTQEVKITRDDWVKDFYPVFENQKYQVFEIPVPSLNEKTTLIQKHISEAIACLPLLEEAKHQADWNRVIKESRPVWELVKYKAEITKLLEADGMEQSVIDAFQTLVQSLFDFSSKFVHRLDLNKKLMGKYNASKEDAEFIYTMSFSVLNLLSRKALMQK